MLCTKCHKNEASVYLKQNINGEVREYALCSHCAAGLESGFAPLNLFGSFLAASKPAAERKRCTLCASTVDEIRKNGRVGCAECYSVFSRELAPMIENLCGSAQHAGRTPKGYSEKRKAENELESLRAQLRAAIESEEYEKAAGLRDLIKEKEAKND